MTPIETYLSSEKAAQDVASHLSTRHPSEMSCGTSPAGFYTWKRCPAGDWTHIELSLRPENEPTYAPQRHAQASAGRRAHGQAVAIYFRKDGDRHVIISDLGEAWRALALRTGDLSHPAHLVPVDISALLRSVMDFKFHWFGNALSVSNVPGADLPRALCAVLLAVYRVSHLENL